ncbi:MAG TPA: cytochrome P450, partial [Roseiarcus sp.]|nr:cytochrome P450 [Roseiarcus sp.]
QTIPLKRYLVSTTGEFRNRIVEPTRFSPPPNPKIHRLPAPVEKVGLEALRLYPPVPHIFRDAIGPDDICGESIGANTQVWMSPWVMHRHRRFWDRPTAFLPSRFAGKTAPWTQTPAYIPFGAGPRICIGFSFALSEAQIVVAQLLSRYRISLPDARPVLPVGRVTIEPSYEPLFRLDPV